MTPTIQFIFVGQGDDQTITVFRDGGQPGQASSSHPNFKTIVKLCLASSWVGTDVDEVIDLIDVGKTIEKKFSVLSDRVMVRAGRIYFDGDEVQSALSKQILRFLDEGEEVDPLVKFYEKIEANPSVNSKEQAFAWLNHHDFSITPSGDVIGYKGCRSDGQGGFVSTHAGQGIVDGVEYAHDYLPNYEGAHVSIPRSVVADDPSVACHVGLHVGTFSYAKSYAHSGVLMSVIVDPRDIVSVPNDASGQKIRVCAYKVHEFIDLDEGEIKTALAPINLVEPGDRLMDRGGDWATVGEDDCTTGVLSCTYDDPEYPLPQLFDTKTDTVGDDSFFVRHEKIRNHGHGGPTSYAAKGNGWNNAQDPSTGRFSAGRPASARDSKTGRFA